MVDLADKYNAMIMVDDAHAIGVIGEAGQRHRLAFRLDRQSAI